MCSVCLCEETVVDSCNVVATEHGRYGTSCTYVVTIECMSSAGSV